jgi:hypothetical protein
MIEVVGPRIQGGIIRVGLLLHGGNLLMQIRRHTLHRADHAKDYQGDHREQ